MVQTGEFFAENGVIFAILLAFLSLIQPWIIVLWRKYFKTPQLEIYPSGKIEIGYNDFGPTVGIQGVFLAKNEDVFIKRIRLKIKIQKSD